MPNYFDDSLDDPLSYERVESHGDGMNMYVRATQLPADAFQYGENILVPENLMVRTRPGADSLTGGVSFVGNSAGVQGLFYFDKPNLEQLLSYIYQYAGPGSGFAYWDGNAWVDAAGFNLASNATAFSAAQGIDKVLVTGGVGGRLARWDGAAWTVYGLGNTDPPSGATVVLWAAGRMFASGFPGGTAGKENDAICVSALLAYGAGDWDLTDRSFRVGQGEGDPIVGLVAMPASVPQQAVLGVLKQNSIHLVRINPTLPITSYSDVINPEIVAGGLGVVGKRAFAVIGNDLLYVSPDRSIRSLARMEAATAQYAVGPALSVPLQPIMDRINWDVADTIAVVRYQNLALFSVPLDDSLFPNTVLVWNGRLQRWVGIWTGWTPNCWEITRFDGKQRLVHGDNEGNVRQWKDFEDQTLDATYLDDGAGYVSKYDSRAFLFQQPLNPKNARYVETAFGISNALVNCSLVADSATVATWSKNIMTPGPVLPIDLDFQLSNPNSIPKRKGLMGLQSWNEAYIHIESDPSFNGGGWWSLQTISFGAFIDTLAMIDAVTP